MTGSQTIRNAARELDAEHQAEAGGDMTDADYARFFSLVDHITNDRKIATMRPQHRRQHLENIALRNEQETALEEFVGWFQGSK